MTIPLEFDEYAMSELFNPIVYAFEVADEAIRYHLGEVMFWGLVAGGTYAAHEARVAHILHSGKYRGPSAVIQTTWYDPAVSKNADTGACELLINPATGNNFRDQKIRTEEVPFDLTAMFNKDIANRLVKYFKKATDLATYNFPIVYTHLEAVLPDKDKRRIHELIKNSVQNYVSGLYRDTEKFLAEDLAPNEMFETRKILPLLIREEGAAGPQLRMLLLRLNEDNSIDLPDPCDVRYLMSDGSYKEGEGSLETDRFKAMQIIKRTLDFPASRVPLMEYAVEIPTGRKISFPAPAVSAP